MEDLPFHDVSSRAKYAKALCWAYEQGLVSGREDGAFYGTADVTRQELAVMLYRGLKASGTGSGSLTAFSDGSGVASWARDAVSWAVGEGLLRGSSDGRLNQLQNNIYWSQRSNNITIPTDCPTREKAGWTGDVVVYGATALYNQEMTAFFDAGTIRHLDVSGNVQAIFLPEESDSTFNKIANVECSFLSADFVNQTIDRMKFWPESSGTTTPLYLAKKSLFYLPQFRWFEPIKPSSPEDVFNVSFEMLELMKEPPFGSRQGRSAGGSAPVAPSKAPEVQEETAEENGEPVTVGKTERASAEAVPAEEKEDAPSSSDAAE